MPTPWSREEVEATVADYLHMWLLEQAGQAYNKTTHRKVLLRKRNDRTLGVRPCLLPERRINGVRLHLTRVALQLLSNQIDR